MASLNRFRRPRNPIMRACDDAITFLEHHGYPVDTGSVAANATKRLRLGDVMANIQLLISPHARQRLIARNYLVVDDVDYERKERAEVTAAEFHQQVLVKETNQKWIVRHLKADKAVERFLVAQENKLGRPVTMGEFELDIEKIYARYGV